MNPVLVLFLMMVAAEVSDFYFTFRTFAGYALKYKYNVSRINTEYKINIRTEFWPPCFADLTENLSTMHVKNSMRNVSLFIKIKNVVLFLQRKSFPIMKDFTFSFPCHNFQITEYRLSKFIVVQVHKGRQEDTLNRENP